MQVIAVAVGGFIGACLRYIVGLSIPLEHGFPYATLMINLSGCLALAYFMTSLIIKGKMNPLYTLAISVGLIGSFTTFSTFSVEALNLFENHQPGAALGYIGISIFGGIGLALLGVKLAHTK